MHPEFYDFRRKFDSFMYYYLNKQNIPSERLKKAMQYSLFGGGKKVRAMFCYSIANSLNITETNTNLATSCIEMIHTYSLIHDDLPDMDNDCLRRGKPSCHIKFDKATAILAGDALQNLAFQTISDLKGLNVIQLKKIIKLVSICTGSQGMVSGQQLDIEVEGKDISLNTLKIIHQNKTGKLFEAAMLIPHAMSYRYLDYNLYNQILKLSECIGLAFQIKDDLLDVTCDETLLGKTTSDIKKNKMTYPYFLGIEETKKVLENLIRKSHTYADEIKTINTDKIHSLINLYF